VIHFLYQEISLNFCFFEVFLDQKFISKAVFSSDVWSQQWKYNCIVSTNFLAQKSIGKKFFFCNFFVSRNIFKKGDCCWFLASKNYDKIWHCFNIFCNFCVSGNFSMSPVSQTRNHSSLQESHQNTISYDSKYCSSPPQSNHNKSYISAQKHHL